MINTLSVSTPFAKMSTTVTDNQFATLITFLGAGLTIAGLVMLSQSKS